MQKNLRLYSQMIQMNKQFMKLNPIFVKNFAATTSGDIVAKNYIKFKTRYDQHMKNFREKIKQMEEQQDASLVDKKTNSKPYTHPYHNDHHPLNFSPVKTAELFHDFIGPEQVSPHYENFMVARKFLIGFWAGLFILQFGVATVDLHWMMKSSFIPFVFWIQLMYMYMEGRKSFFKPLLMRFYRRIAANEIYNFEVFYNENIENKLRELMRIAKNQMEFSQIHFSYQDIKAESVNNFLANEHVNLQKHITERTVGILKQAEAYEFMNKQKYLTQIVDAASTEIDTQLKGPNAKKIQADMLASAIQGLSKGYMDYANDPILPMVQQIIKKKVDDVTKMTPKQQADIVSLTKEQVDFIRDQDQRARQEYLTGGPKGMESSLKNNDVIKKVLARWGN